jgi:pyruvate,water dikinase
MKRKGEVIEVDMSQTGRMKGNNLRLTKDHKMLTYENAELVSKEIQEIINQEEMLLSAQKIPSLTESNEKDNKLAYLLGAICTDGNVYLSRTHGEVQFIQKPTEEKQGFIAEVKDCFEKVFNKTPKTFIKKESSGTIRGKSVTGNANSYRVYSKQIAEQISEYKQNLVQMLLKADESLVYNFLAGVIDGDGSFNSKSSRVNIYCSNEQLLQSVMVSCLRLSILPQVTINRNIYNIQIVERIDEILSYTKRVKGSFNRKTQGTRFFSAKQIIGNTIDGLNCKGKIRTYLNKNLLIDSEKIKSIIIPSATEEIKQRLQKILDSDTRMQRVSLSRKIGEEDVYNITVEGNHNYLVFTDRYTPVIVNNCHAAIISRELGIPCVVGTRNGTEVLKNKQAVTVSCAEGEDGKVYKGLLKYKVEKINLKGLAKPKTKIMMNVGNPDQAFELSFIPNEGVGLAREEFIINEYIKIHPLALIHFKTLKDEEAKKKIEEMTIHYKDKKQFFIDKLAQGVAMIGAAFYPKDVIVRMSDFKSNEYANLIGGKEFEPKEDNPMIGWRGASRYYSEKYKEGFALECMALKKVREDMGLTNVKIMIPFCRTVEEGQKVQAEMKKHGLERGKNGLQMYVMCEIPSNVILAEEFSKIFDGFSIGSNDLTQLTLGVDRDSELVSHIYNERNDAVKTLIATVIQKAKKAGRKIGICGQAPSDFPDFAQFLVKCEIDSISLNPDTVVKTTLSILDEEKKLSR